LFLSLPGFFLDCFVSIKNDFKGKEKKDQGMNDTKIAEVNTLVRKNSKNELARLCRERNLSFTGTKHDMAVRLIGGLEEKKEALVPQVRKIVIARNAEGQWEWEGLVFDEKTKNVVGRRGEGGVVCPLQRQDIEVCKQHKFRYLLPDILNERPDATRETVVSSDEEEDDDDPALMVEDEDECGAR
jgi:hypothetical protein